MSAQLLLLAIILFFGSVLQSSVGFGFGLFTTPLMLWAGLGLEEAIAVGGGSVLVQLLVGLYKLADEIRWKEVWFAVIFRCLSLPLGLLVLVSLTDLPIGFVKQFVGAFILCMILTQLLLKVKPTESIHVLWGVLAFSLSGFLNGMIGMGGPPLVLWVAAHDWNPREVRAFLLSTFLLSIPLNMALLCYHFGQSILYDVSIGVGFAPVLVVGSLIGVRLGNLLSKARLRQLAYGLLVCIALTSLGAPLL